MLWKRIILVIGACLAGIYALWLLGATWFARDGIGRINRAQSDVTFSMGSAVSWWPGRLSGRNLRVTVHDSNVEIDMHFDRFALDVDLRQLAERRFVTRATRLDGVTFYFRSTRKLPELCAYPTLPPITGQASADAPDCLAQQETARPDRGGNNDDVWRLDLNGIELTHVRDVWLEDIRLQGKGAVNGRLYLWPGEELDLATHAAHWSEAKITIGASKPLATVASLDAAAVMRDKDVARHHIWEEVVSADLTVSGAVVHLAPFGAGGVARGDLEAHMRDGLASGVSATAHSDDFFIDLGGKKLAGVLDARLRAESQRELLHVREAMAALREVKVDGKTYDGADMVVRALPGGRVDPRTGKGSAEVVASGKSARPLFALLPSTFGSLIATVVVGPDAPITGAVKLEAAPHKLVCDPFTLEGGALSIAGRLALLPKLKGDLVARVGPLSKTIVLE